MTTLLGLNSDDEPMPRTTNTSRGALFLALLFSVSSPLSKAAAALVSRIELDWQNDRTAFNPSMGVLQIGAEMFEGKPNEMELELARVVFFACGTHVQSIRLNHVPQDE